MRPGVGLSLLCLMLVLVGCRSNRRQDLVEAELRTKERMLRETQAELDQARVVNEAFERDFMNRSQGLPPTYPSSVATPKDITLANGTGGVDSDNQPGDEALMVVVVPRDEDNNPVRAVGSLTVYAWEIMPGGTKVPLSSWEIGATDLRRFWKSGLLGSGYQVRLEWKKLPTTPRLRIAAQLTLSDGRTFEADKDVSIRPFPAAPTPVPPPPEKVVPAAPLPEGPPLP